jgi:pimeloyl-ACP methyl ester carboxylesterase
VQRQYVHLDNGTIAYYDSAPREADKKVLLLAHAFPLAASMWEPQFKALPAGWRFIAPDMRGFGGSTIEHEPESPSMDDYAADIIDLLKELGVQAAVVGGCSMGGYIAFAVARKAPQMLRGLVLADTRASADTLEGRANRKSLLAVLEREGASGVGREMMPKLLGKTSAEERPDVESNIRRLIKQQSPQAIRGAALRMMERPDSFATLENLNVPVLVIVGEEDTLTPVDDSRKMVAALSGTAELVVVPRAGHLANVEAPDAFNSALTAFLSRL